MSEESFVEVMSICVQWDGRFGIFEYPWAALRTQSTLLRVTHVHPAFDGIHSFDLSQMAGPILPL